jgi:hypothetical protein
MSINLNLKNYRQPPNSNLCGQYCIQMVLDKFGIDGNAAEVCQIFAGGMFESGVALALLRMGLKSVFYDYPNGNIFWGKHVSMTKKELLNSFKRKAIKSKKNLHKKILSEIVELIEKDAVSFDLPTRELIERELDQKHPWIVGVTAYVLYDWQTDKDKKQGHFIVIQGYNDKNFIINDPAHDSGGVKEISKDKLLYAMYSSGDGSAVCVKGVGA